MKKRHPKFSPVLWAAISGVAAMAFLASYWLDASPRLVQLAAIAEHLLHCPTEKAPSGFQFFRLLRALAFLPFLLAMASTWHSRQVRQGKTVSRESFYYWLVILFGCFLRIDLWATKSFWCDTWALKAGITTHTAMELATQALGFNQSAPIGFSILSKAIGSFTDNSDLAITFPLLLASCLTLIALSHLTGRLLRPRTPLLVALFCFIFAVNPSFIYYGAEFKPYGIDLLMSALALVLLFRLEDGKTCFSELLLFSILAPLFSLPSFFVLPFLYLSLLVHFRNDRRSAFRIFLCGVAAMPIATYALIHAFSTMPRAMDNIQELFAPVSFTKETVRWWLGRILHSFRGPAYFGFTTWSISAPGILLSAIPLGLFLIGAWSARKERWVWMSLGVIAATVFASICHYWKINPGASLTSGRLILFLAPFAYLPCARGLSWTFRRSTVAGGTISVFATASCSLFFMQQVPDSCPMESIASRIASEWEPGSILVTDEIMLLSLLDTNASWIKDHAANIRMLYSSPTYDDSEFSSIDTYTTGIRRIPSKQQTRFLMETEFGTATKDFILFYSLHENSRNTVKFLRSIRSTTVQDSISTFFFEFSSFLREAESPMSTPSRMPSLPPVDLPS